MTRRRRSDRARSTTYSIRILAGFIPVGSVLRFVRGRTVRPRRRDDRDGALERPAGRAAPGGCEPGDLHRGARPRRGRLGARGHVRRIALPRAPAVQRHRVADPGGAVRRRRSDRRVQQRDDTSRSHIVPAAGPRRIPRPGARDPIRHVAPLDAAARQVQEGEGDRARGDGPRRRRPVAPRRHVLHPAAPCGLSVRPPRAGHGRIDSRPRTGRRLELLPRAVRPEPDGVAAGRRLRTGRRPRAHHEVLRRR